MPPKRTIKLRFVIHRGGSFSPREVSYLCFLILHRAESHHPLPAWTLKCQVGASQISTIWYQMLIHLAFEYQEFADMVRKQLPDVASRVPMGTPGKYDYKSPGVYTLENGKSIKELGITCKQTPIHFHDEIR